MQRRAFLKTAALAAGATAFAHRGLGVTPLVAPAEVPRLDLHVHLTDEFPIGRMLELAGRRGLKLGIVEHPADWALKNDDDLRRYLDLLRPHGVHIGLQPVDLDWRRRFSPELLAEVDYILQDPQIFTMPDGERLQIWEFNTYVEDQEVFMERYLEHSLRVLNTGGIDIFAWPLFLPVCIARDYHRLWTPARQRAIIDAAKAHKVAIEINDMAHTPHEEFILEARRAGLKFTLGSDSRNQNVGRLGYCRAIIRNCGLQPEDFWVPTRRRPA